MQCLDCGAPRERAGGAAGSPAKLQSGRRCAAHSSARSDDPSPLLAARVPPRRLTDSDPRGSAEALLEPASCMPSARSPRVTDPREHAAERSGSTLSSSVALSAAAPANESLLLGSTKPGAESRPRLARPAESGSAGSGLCRTGGQMGEPKSKMGVSEGVQGKSGPFVVSRLGVVRTAGAAAGAQEAEGCGLVTAPRDGAS